MTARGVPATFHYEGGPADHREARAGPPRLPAPRHRLPPPGAGGLVGTAEGGPGHQLLVHPVGLPAARGHRDRPARRAGQPGLARTTTPASSRKHWEGARQISIGTNRDRTSTCSPTATSCCATDLHGKDGDTPRGSTRSSARGSAPSARSSTPHDHRPRALRIDVFLATDADTGALLEFAIPRDEPTTYARTGAGRQRLVRHPHRRADGVVPEPEERAHSTARSSAVDITGAVRLWTDRRPSDGDGSDIAEWGVLKPSWKPMPYSD